MSEEASAMKEGPSTDLGLGELEEEVMKKDGFACLDQNDVKGNVSNDFNSKGANAKSNTVTVAQSSGSAPQRQGGKSFALVTPSTSMPGAFAIDNPLRDNPVADSLRESQVSSREAESAASPTLRQESTSRSLRTAEAVAVAVADPIHDAGVGEDSNCNEGESNGTKDGKGMSSTLVAFAIVVLFLLVIILSVVLAQKSPVEPEDEIMPPTDEQTERRKQMIDFLGRLTPSDAFLSGNSKYSADRMAALRWIVEEDPMQLEIPESDKPTSDPDVWKLLQRYVLALLYFSTNGEAWTNDFSFLSEYDVCRWSTAYADQNFFDIDPDRDIEVRGVACDFDGRIHDIRLYWNNLSGTLPEELTLFSGSMKNFLIGGGSMTGTIPSFVESFSDIEMIGLNDHCFTGTIPEGLTQIPSLSVVTIYNNNNLLSGSLEEFCESPTAFREGTVAIIADSEVDCSCCALCHTDRWECDDPVRNATWPAVNVYPYSALDSQGNMIQFTKECINPTQREWIAEECPCVINTASEPGDYAGQCNNCTAVDAIPSYGN